MGQIAFFKMFLLVSIPTDINDNRRHVHVFRKGHRHLTSVAKIWIESGGEKCMEIAYSSLSSNQNIKVSIKKLDFKSCRGKMLVYLTDGRQILVPLSFFPDIKNLSVKERSEWIILDNQFFTFSKLSKVYSIEEVMRLS